jgi:hypothetical protein
MVFWEPPQQRRAPSKGLIARNVTSVHRHQLVWQVLGSETSVLQPDIEGAFADALVKVTGNSLMASDAAMLSCVSTQRATPLNPLCT